MTQWTHTVHVESVVLYKVSIIRFYNIFWNFIFEKILTALKKKDGRNITHDSAGCTLQNFREFSVLTVDLYCYSDFQVDGIETSWRGAFISLFLYKVVVASSNEIVFFFFFFFF